MLDRPHELDQEFPEEAERIRSLKRSNPYFSRLAETYNFVNREVHRSEDGQPLDDDFIEIALRRKRAHVRAEIFRLLAMGAAQPIS